MANILVIEPQNILQSTLSEILSDYNIHAEAEANAAIKYAAQNRPDLVIMEMSLAGHSGMEFLYEFRTYLDWSDVPVIVYSSLKLSSEVLESKSWKQLKVYEYIYKPEASLAILKSAAQRAMAK